MKLEAYQTLHCDAGWRRFSFLKLIAEDGTTGISEYNECYGSPGLTGVIEGVLEWIIGKNPFSHEKLSAELYARTRQAHGGIAQQAIAAVENALVDLKARSLGVPVYELLGGAVREELPLYWSHCGSYRLPRTAEMLGVPPLTSLDDLVSLGKEVREKGFSALKTNIFLFEEQPHMHQPGFARSEGWPALNPERRIINSLKEQLAAFREGAGPELEILLDLNFNYRTEGFLTVCRALDDLGPAGLKWIFTILPLWQGSGMPSRHRSPPVNPCLDYAGSVLFLKTNPWMWRSWMCPGMESGRQSKSQAWRKALR